MELQLETKFNGLSRIYNYSEVIIVGILVAVYLFLSNYFYWAATFTYGGGIAALPTSGGSDPYYNFVAILHILNLHTQLVHDPTLNYPLGTINPRNPFFHWLIALVAEILSPIYGTQNAAFYVFEEFDAVFGAFLIIPVYLITKEIFGKNAAGVGALLYTLMPSNLSAGILSGGRMHTPELIFAFFAIYFFLRAIKLSEKTRIIENLSDFKTYHIKIYQFFNRNRIATIYGLLAGASLGGLMLSWQGYAYIEAILLIYVAVQLVVNLIFKRPTGYITYYTTLFIFLGFAMGLYYYVGVNELSGWYNAELEIGLVMLIFGALIGLVGRRPWVLVLPVLIIAVVAGLEGMAHLSPALFYRLISGDGYFIKTRVYTTIAEAAAPALGSYIGGFGIAQFLLGIVGVGYGAYLFLKEKTDQLLLILVFSVVSIYMSFEAARFNITAAPAYAILAAGVLLLFSRISRLDEVKQQKPSASSSPFKAVKGNIKWLQAVFVLFVTLLIVLPAATSMVSASVPAGSSAQVQIENQIANSLPGFLKTNNTTNFVGGLSGGISNGSTPLSKSFAWLSTQNSNLPIQDKPSYLSWWDYGFQERYQGQHPTVADDFQQAVEMAGQTLLAQNESQIISLFVSRLIQANFTNGDFNGPVKNTLIQYLGYGEYNNLTKVSSNPTSLTSVVLASPSIYGQYIKGVSGTNVYFAYIKGQLASKYSVSTLVNLYQAIMADTGYSIKYLQIPTDSSLASLLPTSAQNTGIFYAPAFLTDSPSYSSPGGGIIPTEYYNIYANTNNGTFSLQNLPQGYIPNAYNIQFTPQFYNTSIYRFTVGLPPSVLGQSNGIPGISYGSTQYSVKPAWNMSNFMVVYENVPYNPYKDYSAHPSAWTTVPLSQAYYYQQHKLGTVDLTPPVSTSLSISDPIIAYYSGATIHGRVTMPDGNPVPGVHVTLFDQYGIPHGVVQTNSQGYYNVTGLPGNDTIFYSTGPTNNQYLIGNTTLGTKNVYVSTNQANRIPTSYNQSTGLPDYYIQQNLQLSNTTASGNVAFQYQQSSSGQNSTQTKPVTSVIKNGTITYSSSQYNLSYSAPIIGGEYSLSNLPPISYKVSLKTGGRTFSNVQTANISNGGNVVYNVKVPYDVIFANVTLAGKAISGIGVSATSSNGYVAGSTKTNAEGTATIWVTPGIYNVSTSGAGVGSFSQSASFLNWGSNTTLQLSPELSANVTIGISGNSADTSVKLLTNGLLSNAISLSSSNGIFTGSMPYGVYTIYATDGQMSYMKTVVLNGTYSSNISLQPSSNITLASNVPGATRYSGTYEILNNSAMLSYDFATTSHKLTVQIPEGVYSIAGIGIYTGGTSSAYDRVNLFGNQSLNLSLTSNNSVSALLYNQNSTGSYNAKSAITSGIVILKDGGFPVYYDPVGSSGIASLYYQSGTNSGLTVTFAGSYYTGNTVNVGAQQVPVPVSPIEKSLQVSLNSTLLTTSFQTLTLASSQGTFDFTLLHGTGLVKVPIGVYGATINQSGIQSLLDPGYTSIDTGTPSNISLNLVQFANVSVKNANVAKLYYLNGTAVNGLKNVKTGHYILYAYNSSLNQVNLSKTYVTSSTTISPNYISAYGLNLSNSLGLNSGTYSITSGIGTINASKGSIMLPQGTYSVSYIEKQSNSTGSFIYSGSGSLSLKGNAALNVSTTENEVFATVTGNINYGNTPYPNTYIEYVNANGNVVASSLTNNSGGYTIKSPTGLYTVYAVNNASKLSSLGAINIPAYATSYGQNLTLTRAYSVSFSVNLESKTINNPVNITTGNSQLVAIPNSGSLLLPEGGYDFSSTLSSSEQSVDGSYLSVSYSSSVSMQLSSNQVVPLTLSKVVVHSFQVKLLSSVATINKGGNLTYQFILYNNGNSNETVSLASGSSSWQTTFVGNSTIPVGGNSTFTMNATLSGKQEYGAGSIPFNVKYSGGSKQLSLPVVIAKSLNYSLKPGISPIYIGNKAFLPIILNNTGNGEVTVNLSFNETVLNQNGWSGIFNGTDSTNLTVVLQYNTVKTVYVSMSPKVANPPYPVSFNVNATSTGLPGKAAYLTLESSPSASVTPYPTGPLVTSNYTGTPTENLIAGIVVIVVAVVAGLGISAYRGRKS